MATLVCEPQRPAQVIPPEPQATDAARVILSFDVEEHHRIEAGVGLRLDPPMELHCRQRLDTCTRQLLDLLAEHAVQATFFIVGESAVDNPALVRAIAAGGHEVASHGWDHQRLHRLTPALFREDLRKSKQALEDLTGLPVLGYRAPTFSITQKTAWGLDVLAEAGFLYDSSVYPVRHDRYGVPHAPRGPFVAKGHSHSLLELPPATLKVCGLTAPMGGGGYFRLFPLAATRWAVAQTLRDTAPAVAMLYFHPWEFDEAQRRLPLGWLKRFRTYVGVRHTRTRLAALLTAHRFSRADTVARSLMARQHALPCFPVAR